MAAAAGRLKIAIVGDKGVGKGTFARRFAAADFECVEDKDAEVFSITVPTEDGDELSIDLFVQQSDAPTDALLEGAKAAIIMFDTTSRMSYKNVPTHYREICRVCDDIPIVLVGTKVDYRDRKVKPKAIMFHRKKNLRYYDVSATANYQVIEPLSWLLAKTTGDGDLKIDEVALELVPADADALATVNDLSAAGALYDAAVMDAMRFPDDDDDL